MRRQLTLFEAARRTRTDSRPARRVLPVGKRVGKDSQPTTCNNTYINNPTGRPISRRLLNRPPCNGTDTSNEAARRIRPLASQQARRVFEFFVMCDATGATDLEVQRLRDKSQVPIESTISDSCRSFVGDVALAESHSSQTAIVRSVGYVPFSPSTSLFCRIN